METAGAIEVVAEIVFAGPEQLDRDADSLCDPSGLDHVVIAEPAPEAASAAKLVDGYGAGENLKGLSDDLQAGGRGLARRPDFELAILIRSRAVLRFQRSVRQEWVRVGGLDDLRSTLQLRVGIAVVAQREDRRLAGDFDRTAGKRVGGLCCGCPFLPLHL